MYLSPGHNRNKGGLPSWVFPIALVLGLVGLVFFCQQSDRDGSNQKPNIDFFVYCNAENLKDGELIQGGDSFSGGSNQSTVHAHSGQYSVVTQKESNYGLGYELKNPVPGQRYKASIWAFRTSGDRGTLAVSGPGPEDFYQEERMPVLRQDDGWELIDLYFQIPEDTDLPFIRIYSYMPKNMGAVYFDDLEIRSITPVRQGTTASFLSEQFNLTVDRADMAKLERNKWAAVAKGLLITDDLDWVPATLESSHGSKTPVNIRLKGDWLDHIQGKKWSFRVKVRKQQTWNRMRTLSFQSPHTRMFLSEWVYHKMMHQEDVLAPRYDFLRLSLNGESRGIYAIEEHFEKYLVEYNKRREGPILKLTEDGYWYMQLRDSDLTGGATRQEHTAGSFMASDIRPFKESKTLNSPQLNAAFEAAQNLLTQYKFNTRQASEVFDIEHTARYYALMDINHAYHGLAWHNQRFYYNPVSSRLEPIGFDGFGGGPTNLPKNKPFLGYFMSQEFSKIEMYKHLFSDPLFFQQYCRYLDRFSGNDWLQRFIQSIDEDLKQRQALINIEFKDYEFKTEELLDNAKKIQVLIHPLNKVSLKARQKNDSSGKKIVSLSNQHCLPLEVKGYGRTEKDIDYTLNEKIFLFPPSKFEVPQYTEVEVPSDAQYIYFHLAGVDSSYFSPIVPWTKITPDIERQRIEAKATFNDIPFLIIRGTEITIPEGDHILNRDLVIPAGHRLVVLPGAKVDMIDGAMILCYGAFTCSGTEDHPIAFSSSDHTANGITIIQAKTPSLIQYTIFDGLNTLARPNWTLTGAVTFYESDVDIRKSAFINNVCEDALNIIRSRFDADEILIKNTLSDGFDADFCSGRIRNSRFEDTGNDGMDFSGSAIRVESTEIIRAGDKGLSVGEEADVEVGGVLRVQDSNIGVASKDLSSLVIDHLILSNCKQGVAAYQKKPEFGPATIELKRLEYDQVKQLYLIETSSSLIVNGEAFRN